jgi:penicillin-binding protein 1A
MTNSSDNSQKRRNSKKGGSSKVFLLVIIVFAVMITGIGLGFLTASLNTKPSLANDIRPPASSQIYDINGNLITNIHSAENRVPVKLNKIPKNLINAFVAVEDARFYQHSGIDPRGILRAVWSNITNHGVSEGGSTITQQLAKNAYLTQEQTIKRKIQEAFLALQLERQFTKNEILELYLNQIYFGQGAYGVQAAAQTYFGKNVEDLSLSECAMLAGIPKSPNYYSPLNNFKAANERKSVVLEQMQKYEYLDSATAHKANTEEIKLVKHTASKETTTVGSYFIDYVTQKLIDKYGADAVYKEGLKIYTTLDLDMQRAAENAMKQLPTYRTDDNGIEQPQGALVAIEPHTGYIKAMVGGRGNDQFNRATMAERQPGSSFKPFVFLAAIESNLTPATIIEDSPITIGDWTPQNYDHKFNGKVTLRLTAEHSLNVPTVKIAQQIGVDKPLYYAQQMGISTLVLDGPKNDRNLSMALGGLTKGVTPLELASAYGVFANSGTYVAPTAIVKIIDRNGKVLEQHAVQEKNVISAKSAYILTDILRGVIIRGTGTGANIGRPAAGKTGTTSDYKDAWFVGYTPDLVASVWIGNDNDGTLRGITGADKPADIWKAFMNKALSGVPSKDFIKPAGVVINDTPTTLDDDKEADKDKDTKEKDKDKLKDAKDKDKSKLPDKKDKPASTDSKINDSKQSEQPAIPGPVAPTTPSMAPVPERNKN